MRDFRKLKTWTDSIAFVKEIYGITKEFPDDEKFGLVSQLRRAAVSIPSNIAEGNSRNSNIEYKRFLEISIGSAFEVETQLIIAKEIGYLSDENLETQISEINSIQKQINGIIRHITKIKD